MQQEQIQKQEPIQKGNKGEKCEIAIKKMLYERKNDIEFLVPTFGNDACEGIEIINPSTKQPYTAANQISKKAPSGSKADSIILFLHTRAMRYVSIKSLSGAKPSIVNHTRRSAYAFQILLQTSLAALDALAAEYIKRRTQKEIGEDIMFCKLDCYSDENIKANFIKTLSYFVFTGTGKGLSANECDSLLIVNKDNSLNFIDCSTAEKKANYINATIDKCVISFRNKGMLTKISDGCRPWIYTNETNGKPCGSIHVRL